jgi:hypothetical protein
LSGSFEKSNCIACLVNGKTIWPDSRREIMASV